MMRTDIDCVVIRGITIDEGPFFNTIVDAIDNSIYDLNHGERQCGTDLRFSTDYDISLYVREFIYLSHGPRHGIGTAFIRHKGNHSDPLDKVLEEAKAKILAQIGEKQ